MSDLFVALIACAIAAAYLLAYARLDARYDRDRPAQGRSDRTFAVVYKVVILALLAEILIGAFSDHPLLLEWFVAGALRWLGLTLIVAGGGVFAWATRTLGAQYSPCYDLREPSHVVRVGPYRWVRHPVYVANLAVLSGACLLSGSLWSVLCVAVVAGYYLRAIATEERVLAQRFPEYAQYMRATGRLLPRWRAGRG